jgi:hypothetical protein
MMNGHGQSDGEIVSEKSPNKPKGAEGTEGRSPVKGTVSMRFAACTNWLEVDVRN